MLDQAYQLLGHVGAQADALTNQQQQALTQLGQREAELQKDLAEAEKRGDTTKAAQLHDELDELTRAWRVATQDTEDSDTP